MRNLMIAIALSLAACGGGGVEDPGVDATGPADASIDAVGRADAGAQTVDASPGPGLPLCMILADTCPDAASASGD